MVKLEYRPYLIALVGLTVCVSLYEIAYVQWSADDSRGKPLLTPSANLGTENNDSLSAAQRTIESINHQHKNAQHNRSRRRGEGDGHEDLSDDLRDKTGNRGILSSGRINQDLSGQQEDTSLASVVNGGDRKWPKNDFKNLIDIQNDFDFLINQKPCPVRRTTVTHNNTTVTHDLPDVLVLVLVHSAPRNFRKRLTIRQTWGKSLDPRMKVYFLLGSVNSTTLQFKLEMENERFGDLIQGNFTDTYRNMTYKHIMALKWFSYFCADTPLLLKTDDDVFVNSPALMEYVRENVDNVRRRRKFVKCRVLEKGTVKRSYRSKWRVSAKEYPGSVYPSYCPGFIVMYSGDMVQELYREAQKTKYFWIDDVHVTGTLVQQTNATLTPFRDVFFPKKDKKRLREPYVRNMPLFTDPDLRESEIRRMWSMVAVEGVEGEMYKEGLREDNEAVAYLSAMEVESGAARVRLWEGIGVLSGLLVWIGFLRLET